MIVTSAPTGFEVDRPFEPAAQRMLVVERASETGRHVVIADTRGDLSVWLHGPNAAHRPAALMPLDDTLNLRIEVLERLARRLQGRPAGPLPRALQLTRQRRARLILLLHALDFRLRGAELRGIAAALIDPDHAALPAIEWKSSATRRKANRLVHDAVALMNHGYLKLLRGE
ncbi:DUF2285 domain-containing protein [Xanthobacter oligotrophicus]|uniref:DUF2285 domain-containing protein n=1 Tax=Xanthobacter oligotrophicus TaxID=2607286 RepID=A0ABW7A2Y5_9HYPH